MQQIEPPVGFRVPVSDDWNKTNRLSGVYWL